MTPKFTTPCFIRKNTHELRLKLIELGYYNYTLDFDDVDAYLYTTKIGFHSAHFANDTSRVDCGTNEQLFLALAALREDSDKFQWFTDDSHEVWKREENLDYSGYFLQSSRRWHKATPEELIEHFKEK